MGPKASKQPTNWANQDQAYPTNVRLYTAWTHQGASVSHNHTSLRSTSAHANRHGPSSSSAPAPSRPVDQQPILVNSSQRKNSDMTSMFSKHNASPLVRPRPPAVHANTRGKELGVRRSRSMNQLSTESKVITVQQLFEDQAKRRKKHGSKSSTHSSPTRNLMKSSSSTTVNQLHSLQTAAATAKAKKKIPSDLQLALISPSDLKVVGEIGAGKFGKVLHCLYKGTRDVALKTLNSQHSNGSIDDYEANMFDLLNEAHIMTDLKHPNLLRIVGVTFFGDSRKLSLVTDFMKNGSLLDYLRKHRENYRKWDLDNLSTKLNHFARQIFEAMLYLEEKGTVHRDLAARNCLIGQGDILKVGDFGLSTLTECGFYKGTCHSICAPRWSAPEAVCSWDFSSRSDVWSYGITLWEIYSLGERPFPQLSNRSHLLVLKDPSENLSRHLPKPDRCVPEAMYTHIILSCLTHDVKRRPSFRQLKERLLAILYDRT